MDEVDDVAGLMVATYTVRVRLTYTDLTGFQGLRRMVESRGTFGIRKTDQLELSEQRF